MIKLMIIVKPRKKHRAPKSLARTLNRVIEHLGYSIIVFDMKDENLNEVGPW